MIPSCISDIVVFFHVIQCSVLTDDYFCMNHQSNRSIYIYRSVIVVGRIVAYVILELCDLLSVTKVFRLLNI